MPFAPRITMITLGVSDVAASTAFYERLGFEKSSVSNDSVTFFCMDGTVLGLFGRADLAADAGVSDSPPGFSGVSIAQNFMSEADVDAAFAHALDCGASPVKAPEKVFWGGYSGYVADPDGHLWELAFNPVMPNSDDGFMHLPR
ncbi:glyoxalase [Zhengella mangrovi]|uniref:Glyoxalase n=1 Tax=Zhengella mangrovi TaxID=1982044 RepID=A0A2G1QN22_9HYPH|nr:VOC family protein [Zhengella mangrovi]PHP66864.1 glyoxalase [Zhengella mangrovi]